MGLDACQWAMPQDWMAANFLTGANLRVGWWHVPTFRLIFRASAGHTTALLSLSLSLMRSFFALGLCGLSLTLAGVAATLTDRDQTLAVDAMAAGLVITASAALPGILATNRR
jgi:hypothetical protein